MLRDFFFPLYFAVFGNRILDKSQSISLILKKDESECPFVFWLKWSFISKPDSQLSFFRNELSYQ